MLSVHNRREQLLAVVRVSSGNFLEMYDFIVYGYYALFVANTFFPAKSEFVSLMLSLTTFGAGYLMRPIGAIALGAYIDRVGRRKGLLLTLGLMAVGTLTIALTPGYAKIGVLAPIVVVLGRLLQGLSAGVEVAGVSVYLSEIATEGHRGFYCSWQSASQQLAVVFTALIGLLLTKTLTGPQMNAWGWRVPLIIGCLIIPLIFWLRQSLEETPIFRQRKRTPPKATELLRILVGHWRIVLLGVMLSIFTTTFFYLITAYTPTFGRQALHLNVASTFLVTLCVGVSNFVWLPLSGAMSDRVGRRPFLLFMPILALVTVYPQMSWLAAGPSFGKLLIVELWFSFLYGMYNGAMIPFLTELMPLAIRTSGFALAYSIATALFGGFTPAVCTFLIEWTGRKAAPALWLLLAAFISLISVLLCGRTWRHDPEGTRTATTTSAGLAQT
jgi:MFS transporter, MHS family, citrate/tricarballylate:H+ symporter